MATSGEMSTDRIYIKYKITITQNSQSIANNTSNVTVKVNFYRTNTGYVSYGNGTVYCKINGTTYTAAVTPSQEITNAGIDLFTKTLNITHGSDGKKTLTCSAWISHDVVSSSEQSYSHVLTTIPRKSEMTVKNGTLGTAQTITVTKKSTSFTHTITYACGSYSGTICSKSSNTSISWTPKLDFANGAPNGTSVHISFKIETFSGSTSIGSNSYSIACAIPASVKPTVSFTVSDAMGYSATYGGYIQGKSKFSVSITASGVYNSTIKSYKTTVDGRTFASSSFTSDVIANSGTLTVTVTITDSRGRTATATSDVTVIPYSKPKFSSVSAKRCDSDGSSSSSGAYLNVVFNASVTSINSQNTADYSIKYKKKTETDYTEVTLSDYANNYSIIGGSYVFEADTSSNYDIQLTVMDAFSESASVSIVGSSISKLLSFLNKGLGIAFGKVATIEDAAEFDFEIRANKNVFDRFNTLISNGLVLYTGSGGDAIDPDTTSDHCILTDKNTPTSSLWYITTYFYSNKSSDRTQLAMPYNSAGALFHRYRYNDTWSSWLNTALDSYPVNSIYISYSHTSPAEMFGGTWTRIENRFLWGCTADGSIGHTGGESTHTLTVDEMPSHRHGAHNANGGGYTTEYLPFTASGTKKGYTGNMYTLNSGGGAAHNNLPPYIHVSIWRRTA